MSRSRTHLAGDLTSKNAHIRLWIKLLQISHSYNNYVSCVSDLLKKTTCIGLVYRVSKIIYEVEVEVYLFINT